MTKFVLPGKRNINHCRERKTIKLVSYIELVPTQAGTQTTKFIRWIAQNARLP